MIDKLDKLRRVYLRFVKFMHFYNYQYVFIKQVIGLKSQKQIIHNEKTTQYKSVRKQAILE